MKALLYSQDPAILASIKRALTKLKVELFSCNSINSRKSYNNSHKFDMAFIDYKLCDTDYCSILSQLDLKEGIPIYMVLESSSIDSKVDKNLLLKTINTIPNN